jgi:hypothetical protein
MGIRRAGWPAVVAEFDQSYTGAEELERLPTHWKRAEYCYNKMHELRSKYYQRQREHEYAAIMGDDNTLKGQSDSTRRRIGQQRWAKTFESQDLIGQEQMWSRWASLECSMANLNRHPRGEHPQ